VTTNEDRARDVAILMLGSGVYDEQDVVDIGAALDAAEERGRESSVDELNRLHEELEQARATIEAYEEELAAWNGEGE
jgi:hypothetical protein